MMDLYAITTAMPREFYVGCLFQWTNGWIVILTDLQEIQLRSSVVLCSFFQCILAIPQ